MSRKCETCSERPVQLGYDSCRNCLVDLVENNPAELICFVDQNEILGWIAEAREKRRNPVPVPNLRVRQAS